MMSSRKQISTLDVLRLCTQERIESGRGRVTDSLMEKYNLPYKVCLRAIEREDARGFLDWGVSIDYPWLTEKGRAELERLEKEASHE